MNALVSVRDTPHNSTGPIPNIVMSRVTNLQNQEGLQDPLKLFVSTL